MKLILLPAMMFCFISVSVNARDSKHNPETSKVVTLSLDKAMMVQGLSAAMYAQIDRDHFLDGNHYTYTAEINYNGVHYRVYGTLLEWIRFFKMRIISSSQTGEIIQ